MSDDGPDPAPPAQPELDFDGRYRVERIGDGWHLRGPAFTGRGGLGMAIDGDGAELLAKYRDLADLLNAVVEAERSRSGRR